MKRLTLAVILAAGLTPGLVLAQNDPGAPADNGDSPEHGVARLSIVQGNVSVRHGDAGELTPGAVNAPLVESDRVVTGDQGRAELQFDWANMIRLAPGSEVRLSQLQYKQYQVQIAAGTTMFRVLRQTDAQVEISTPTVSLRPLQPGSYRITVDPDGMTTLSVRDGDAEIFGPKGSEALHRGQTMLARGTPDDPEFQIGATVPADEFDRWNQDRDKLLQQEQTSSYRYVPPDVSGAEQLDSYGQWQQDPQYGNVWVPNEGADWAPYQDGQWNYVDYYGWSWMGAEPWGWAPYHYGNWYHSRWGWAWWPGSIGSRYYWHPAMVGFFGWGGGGFGVGFGGFGFGNVGWVPLAPFEVFHPWYGRGFAGGRGVNIVNNVNVSNVYRNARVAGGVTSMRSGDFGRGAVNANTRVRASSADLSRAGAVRGAMPFTATAQSRQFARGAANTRGVPQTSGNARFFSSRGAGGAAGGGSTAGGGGVARGANTPQAGGGWQRMNSPGSNGGNVNRGGTNPGVAQNRGGAAPNGGAAPGNNGGSGWQRLNGNNTGGVAQAPRTGGAPGGSQGGPGYRVQGGGTQGGGQGGGYRGPSGGQQQGGGYRGPSGGTPNQPSQPGYRSNPAPQSRPAPQQQPVRVNPPIVQNRSSGGGNSGGNSHPPSHAGGFGGGHSSGGGGGGHPSGGGGHGGHR